MRDKRRAVLPIVGGFCLLLILTGVIMDVASDGWSTSVLFGILGLVVGAAIVALVLRQDKRD